MLDNFKSLFPDNKQDQSSAVQNSISLVRSTMQSRDVKGGLRSDFYHFDKQYSSEKISADKNAITKIRKSYYTHKM